MTEKTLNNLRLIVEKGDMPGDWRLMFSALLDDYIFLQEKLRRLDGQTDLYEFIEGETK